VPDAVGAEHTRVHFRLRLAPVRRKWLAETAGGFIDLLTIAGLAAGLKERLETPRGRGLPKRGTFRAGSAR
jgi:hypothetical protein